MGHDYLHVFPFGMIVDYMHPTKIMAEYHTRDPLRIHVRCTAVTLSLTLAGRLGAAPADMARSASQDRQGGGGKVVERIELRVHSDHSDRMR